MPGTLGHRVHDFFSKFRKNQAPVVVEPDAVPEGDAQRREVSIAQLRQGYGEVIDTMQTVRKHLEVQAERSDKMISLLEGLPEVLKAMPQQQETQTHLLQAIHTNMERQNETAGALSTAITGLTSIGERQQQTMGDLQEHLRAEDVARRELRDGIGALDTTLGEVRQTSEASRMSLEAIGQQARDRDAAMSELFRRNQKTTSAMMVVSWALALLALGVAAVVAIQVLRMSGTANSSAQADAAPEGVSAGLGLTPGTAPASAAPREGGSPVILAPRDPVVAPSNTLTVEAEPGPVRALAAEVAEVLDEAEASVSAADPVSAAEPEPNAIATPADAETDSQGGVVSPTEEGLDDESASEETGTEAAPEAADDPATSASEPAAAR